MSNDFRRPEEEDLFDRAGYAFIGLIIGGIASGLLVYFLGADWPKLIRFSIVIFSTFGLAYYFGTHSEVVTKIYGVGFMAIVFLILAGIVFLIWTFI